MVEKPLEDCQEAQQWMELIMRNQGLWHIPEQIFGYLNYGQKDNWSSDNWSFDNWTRDNWASRQLVF